MWKKFYALYITLASWGEDREAQREVARCGIFQENVPQAPMRCKHSPQSHWESLHPIPTLTPTLCLVVGHSSLDPHQDFLSLELGDGVEWEGGRQWMEGNLS